MSRGGLGFKPERLGGGEIEGTPDIGEKPVGIGDLNRDECTLPVDYVPG